MATNPIAASAADRVDFEEMQRNEALKNTLRYAKWKPKKSLIDIDSALDQFGNRFREYIMNALNDFTGLKVWMNFDIEYVKILDENQVVPAFFRTQAAVIESENDIENFYQKMTETINKRNSQCIRNASGLRVKVIQCISLHMLSTTRL